MKTGMESVILPLQGMLPDSIAHYVSLGDVVDLSTLCQSLLAIGINYFLYIRREHDRYLHLTNMPEWIKYFFYQKYYLNCFFHDPSKKYTAGNYLWDGLQAQKIIYHDLKHMFGVDHGITLVQTYQNCDEFFSFGAVQENNSVINLYLNQCCLLKKFILYFKENLAKYERKLNKRVIVPARLSHYIEKHEIALPVSLKRYYVGGLHSDTYLTTREVECLRWYLEGKKIPEIAIILNASPRTVETHLEHIKNKTHCFGRSQLSQRFLQLFKEM